ncbi:MAG: aspartate aminotransferase family protein [Vicinamibacterales bacterium]
MSGFDFDRGIDLVRRLGREAASRPLAPEPTAAIIRAEVDLAIGRHGADTAVVLAALEAIVGHSVNTAHPGFHNQLFSGQHPPAVIGEFVATLLNTTMATWEASPAATLVETGLLERLADLAGLGPGDGVFTTGGSESNMLALLAARHRRYPAIRTSGRWPERPPVVLVSEAAHYSVASAAQALGFGLANVVRVPVDAWGRMRRPALAAAVAESRARGGDPFFVCATAGTSVLGAFDPLDEIAEVADGEDLWLHVDGCLGAPALLSTRWRHLLAGSERADSLVWDAHKLMGVPITCSALVVAEPGCLEAAASPDRAEYLFHESDADRPDDLGPRNIRCARRVDALKLWTAWKALGDEGYEARIDRLFDLAAAAGAAIDQATGLERIAPVQSVSVVFRPVAPAGVDPGWLVRAVRQRLIDQGIAFLNYAPVNGTDALRLLISNADVTDEQVRAIVSGAAAARDAVLRSAEREAGAWPAR